VFSPERLVALRTTHSCFLNSGPFSFSTTTSWDLPPPSPGQYHLPCPPPSNSFSHTLSQLALPFAFYGNNCCTQLSKKNRSIRLRRIVRNKSRERQVLARCKFSCVILRPLHLRRLVLLPLVCTLEQSLILRRTYNLLSSPSADSFACVYCLRLHKSNCA
jgi:hypothetical protein